MRRNYVKILLLAVAAMIILSGPIPGAAVEKKEQKSIWTDEEPNKPRTRWFELTDETIEHMMSRLAQTNPAKAKELEKLRKEDPEKFKTELRKVMNKQFSRKWREQKWGKGGRSFRGAGRGKQMWWMARERHSEFLEWLKKNYPEEAEKLAEVRREKPQLYDRELGLRLRTYRRIFEASKESPELAEVLKQDLQLKRQRNRLLAKIRTTKDADKKMELMDELSEVLNSRYDLIVRRKQIEYENLLKKLEKLKEQVKKSKATVQTWNDAEFKKESVKTRLEELVGGKKQFRWE